MRGSRKAALERWAPLPKPPAGSVVWAERPGKDGATLLLARYQVGDWDTQTVHREFVQVRGGIVGLTLGMRPVEVWTCRLDEAIRQVKAEFEARLASGLVGP